MLSKKKKKTRRTRYLQQYICLTKHMNNCHWFTHCIAAFEIVKTKEYFLKRGRGALIVLCTEGCPTEVIVRLNDLLPFIHHVPYSVQDF